MCTCGEFGEKHFTCEIITTIHAMHISIKSSLLLFLFLKKTLFIYLFAERREGRERNINVFLPLKCAPNWGSGPQPRHVP